MTEIQKLIREKLAQKAGSKESEQIRFSISLDHTTNARLESLALELNLSKSAFCADLITSALKDAEFALNADGLNSKELPLADWVTLDANNNDIDSQLNSSELKLSAKSHHSKSPRTNIRVTMPDGTIIMNPTAAQTFAEVIAAFGIEKVKELRLRCCQWDLISTEKHKKYQQYSIGRYFIMTKTSTPYKKKFLEEIAMRIGIKIKVEII